MQIKRFPPAHSRIHIVFSRVVRRRSPWASGELLPGKLAYFWIARDMSETQLQPGLIQIPQMGLKAPKI